MALDAYASCPCGSGKKFKWCCQPIHAEIDKAFQQAEAGQMEAALRTMEHVTQQHPDNPEAWGRRAQLIYMSDKAEDAEQMLQKAFELNPNYAFGHMLRGLFRLEEGEILGALLLLRKAADLYDPEAHDQLGQLYFRIFDCEMKLNHPVAARAALRLAIRYNPSSDQLHQGFESVFGEANPNLPASAKREYTFQGIAAGASGERRAAWERALGSAATGKLGDAARAFEQLVREDESDTAAWYNLGLSQAWLGNHVAAIESLDRYTKLEADEGRAAAAWDLAEVLRCGQGMEDHADVVEHSYVIPLRDPQSFVNMLGQLEKEGMLTGVQVDQEQGQLIGMLLEKPGPALTPEMEAQQSPKLGSFLMLVGNLARLWHVNKEALDRTLAIVRQRAGAGGPDPYSSRSPVKFFDYHVEGLIFPRGTSAEEVEKRLRSHLEKHFEETWLHQPRKSLGQTPPIDAAGHPHLRKKLRGVVQFLEECGAIARLPYDFNRLRRKLGLLEGTPAPAVAEPAATVDVTSLSAAELAGLPVESLDDRQLDDAFQTALRLDAREIAGKFAETLVQRPARSDKPDRYPLFNHVVQLALSRQDWTAALNAVNEGEKDDCEHNEGKRRNDYELRRGQVHARAGQLTEASDVFDRLIARVPNELKFRVTAVESMLSAKSPSKALALAEAGIAEARKQNHRDSEAHLLELAAAAKKQGG